MSIKLRDDIKKCLLEKRPNLGESSIKIYVSTLSNLPKKLDKNTDSCVFFTDNVKLIMKYLEDIPVNKRKSILSPLVVLTGLEEYQTLMKADINDYQNEIKQQTKTETQTENWLHWDKIMEIYNKISKQAIFNIKSKEINMDLQVTYILLSLFCLIPPRRSNDFSGFMLRNYNTETDNYINFKTKKLIFNDYKTNKKYGKQTFVCPDNLLKILKKWSKINTNDYILGEKKTSNDVTKMLNKIFSITGKSNISANILRHSYLSNYYKNIDSMPSVLEMESLAKQMGHSIAQQMLYIKK
jgi:integrase